MTYEAQSVEEEINEDQIYLESLVKNFRQSGVILLQDLYTESMIADLKRCSQLETTRGEQIVYPSNREVIALSIAGELNSDDFYANGSALAAIMAILPRRYLMITSFCTSISKPGSSDEAINYGHSDLFKLSDKRHLHRQIPPYEVSLIIALNNVSHEGGAMKVWPGSHLSPSQTRAQTVSQSQSIDVNLNQGDGILIDSRLAHQYLSNEGKTDTQYAIIRYSIPWFRNVDQQHKLPCLQICESEYEKVNSQFKFLLDHARGKMDWIQQTYISKN